MNKFIFSEEALEEDEGQRELYCVRMGRVCRAPLNSVNPDLRFKVETTEDFANKRLATVETELQVMDGIIYHSYFEKKMTTPLVLMERK